MPAAAAQLGGSPYSNGCSAAMMPPQFLVNGVGGCSPPAVPTQQLSINSNVPYAGFLVAGFNGFCTEEQLKELLGRCARVQQKWGALPIPPAENSVCGRPMAHSRSEILIYMFKCAGWGKRICAVFAEM